MKKIKISLFLAFILVNFSFLHLTKVICEGGGLSVLPSPDCVVGTIWYTVRGWPIEYYWSNKTGFVFLWYALDFILYFFSVFLILFLGKFSQKFLQNLIGKLKKQFKLKHKRSPNRGKLLLAVFIFIFSTFVLLILKNSPPTTSNKISTSAWNTYTDVINHYSINYPYDMYIDKTFPIYAKREIAIRFINPTKIYIPTQDKTGSIVIETRIGVFLSHVFNSSEEIEPYMSQYVNLQIGFYNEKPIKYAKTFIATKPVYQFEYLGPESNKWISTLYLTQNKLFAFDLTSYEITPDLRERYNKVIASFRSAE